MDFGVIHLYGDLDKLEVGLLKSECVIHLYGDLDKLDLTSIVKHYVIHLYGDLDNFHCCCCLDCYVIHLYGDLENMTINDIKLHELPKKTNKYLKDFKPSLNKSSSFCIIYKVKIINKVKNASLLS